MTTQGDLIERVAMLEELLEVLLEHDPQIVSDEVYVALDGWKADVRSALHKTKKVVRYGGLTPRRRHKVDDCPTCWEYSKDGNQHFPSHDASPRCESGRHNHCTCDTCW